MSCCQRGAWIRGVYATTPIPVLGSHNADIARASQLQHAVEGVGAWKHGNGALPPLVRGLFDTHGDRHAKVGHPIEDRTSDSRLRLLIGQSPGVKAPPNDGLVAEHCRFNKAPSAIA